MRVALDGQNCEEDPLRAHSFGEFGWGKVGEQGKMNASGNSTVGDGNGFGSTEGEYRRRYHRHEPADNQCSSALIKHIKAPLHLVISLSFSLLNIRMCDCPYICFPSRLLIRICLSLSAVISSVYMSSCDGLRIDLRS